MALILTNSMSAACNLTGAIIVYFFLYESSDLSLESVDMMYCDPNCKPWNSRTWAPEGFTGREDLVEQDRAAAKMKSPEGIEEGRVEKVAEPHANGNGYHNGTTPQAV